MHEAETNSNSHHLDAALEPTFSTSQKKAYAPLQQEAFRSRDRSGSDKPLVDYPLIS